MPNITVKDLTLNYKDGNGFTPALSGVNALFLSEKFNCIIGPSGSGKTTLLKCLAGLLPYDGEITFDGVSVNGLKPFERNLSLVTQEFALYPHMTVFDNIAFPLKNAGARREEIVKRVERIADVLDLKYCLTRKPRHISGGQKQRAALARALIKNPLVCLFDEPLSNVDPQMRFKERRFLKNAMASFGCTAVFVTHDVLEATALADKLFVMDGGKIVLQGDVNEVYNSDDPVMTALRTESEQKW